MSVLYFMVWQDFDLGATHLDMRSWLPRLPRGDRS